MIQNMASARAEIMCENLAACTTVQSGQIHIRRTTRSACAQIHMRNLSRLYDRLKWEDTVGQVPICARAQTTAGSRMLPSHTQSNKRNLYPSCRKMPNVNSTCSSVRKL